MDIFTKYRRKQIAELTPVTKEIIDHYYLHEKILFRIGYNEVQVSISEEDKKNGSPKMGDMIARNPKNHYNMWLVSGDCFLENFEPI